MIGAATQPMGELMTDEVPLTFGRATEILWPINVAFRPHMPAIKAGRPSDAADADADKAVQAAYESGGTACWDDLPVATWRVLQDRYARLVIAWQLHRDEVMMTVPHGADEAALRKLLILSLHSSMWRQWI
jgi:hypothetical protein